MTEAGAWAGSSTRLTVARAIVRRLMNQIADCRTVQYRFTADFEAHARAMGAIAETVSDPAELAAAFLRAKDTTKTTVIAMPVERHEGWTTHGYAWWEIGTPEVSASKAVRAKHAEMEAGRAGQRRGV